MDPEMEEMPTDYVKGVDFRITKTTKGGYADYSTSTWARRDRPLGDAEMDAVNKNGLFNLSDFLPKKPDEMGVKVMQEMFEASVDGQPYDADRWSQYFRPSGMAARTGDPNVAPSPNATAVSQSAPAPKANPAPVAETASAAPATPAADTPAEGNASDILAMIRSRQNQ